MYANLIKLNNKIKYNYKCTIIRYLFIAFCQSSNSQERFLFQTTALPPSPIPPPATHSVLTMLHEMKFRLFEKIESPIIKTGVRKSEVRLSYTAANFCLVILVM